MTRLRTTVVIGGIAAAAAALVTNAAASPPPAASPGSAGVSGPALDADVLVQTGTRAIYAPITPCRLADTRAQFQIGPRATPLGADETLTIDINTQLGECSREQLPLSAEALALNVTAVGATAPTFLALWPDGDPPNSSSLNPVPGAPPTPNALAVQLSVGETFNVFNRFGQVDVLIDVVGYFEDHHHDDRYYTEAESDLFRTNVTNRLGVLEAGGSTEGRTIFVGGDGPSGTNGLNLEGAIATAAAGSPTADAPWVVRLDAGSFTTGELTLPAHVHLHGSGLGISTVTGTIVAAGDTSITSLTIDNPGVSTFRSITTAASLRLDRVEIVGNSGIAVDNGADVVVTDSRFVVGSGPTLTMVGPTANADVLVERTSITSAASGIIAMELDGGELTLRDVTGTFASSAVAADEVVIEGSRLVSDGQLQVTNAGTMEVIDSYVERSPATTLRVISVVGIGSELRVVNSSVIGGGGGGDDAVGGDTESCIGVAADDGWFDTTCP